MEKVKLTARDAKQVSITIGREWIVNKIFKEIKSAAMHGITSIVWDFDASKLNMNEVWNILEDCGYRVSKLDEDSWTIKIEW